MVADFGFCILLHHAPNQLLEGGFLEDIDLQDLQQGVKAPGQMESLLHDGHEQADAENNPDPGFDVIGRCAIEGLDPQVLFDPSEEQLDLSAQLEEVRHGLCREREDIGQKHEALFRFGLHVGYPSQGLRIGLSRASVCHSSPTFRR